MVSKFKVPEVRLSGLDRSFLSIRDKLISQIPFFNPEWTDHNPSDFGITLVELFAGLADNLHFYVDQSLNERFIPTAVRRSSIIAGFRPLGLELDGAVAATVDLRFSLAAVPGPIATQTVLEGTRCSALVNGTSIFFETLSDLVFPKTEAFTGFGTDTLTIGDPTTDFQIGEICFIGADSETTLELTLIEKTASTLRFDAVIPAGYTTDNFVVLKTGLVPSMNKKTELEVTIAESNGAPFQTFVIGETSILKNKVQNFLTIKAAATAWTEVDSFAESDPSDEHYTARREGDNTITIKFGNGEFGKIPVSGDGISVLFSTGGGVAGLVDKEAIDTVDTPPAFTVSVLNPLASSGGAPRETIDNAKLVGPVLASKMDVAVTLEDYQVFAESVPGVLKALAVRSGFRTIRIFIVPEGGGTPSTTLKLSVVTLIDSKNVAGEDIEVLDANFFPVNVSIDARAFENFENDDVGSNISDTLADFFDEESQVFGITDSPVGNVFRSDVVGALELTDGVDNLDIIQLSAVSTPIFQKKSGSATFSAIVLTSTVKAETWTVRITTSGTNGTGAYTIEGSISDTFGPSVLGSPITGGGITFTLSDSGISLVGDKATFRTSDFVGNIPVNDGEFPTLGNLSVTVTGGV